MGLEQTLGFINGIKGNRRRALKIGVGGTLLALGLAEYGYCQSPEQKANRSVVEMRGLIQQGMNMRTAQDTAAVFGTNAAIDLPYSRLATVERVRAISDPVKRVTAAIGFLDVENRNNRRYDVDDGSCNIYALDLSRLLLGNNVIGSRFNSEDGSPAVLGLGDADWTDVAAISGFNEQFPYLAAFNLDDWMRTHGTRYGWLKVNSPAALSQIMHTKEYIALGVTRDELIRTGRVGNGHSYVLTYGAEPGYGLTQATNNISYNWVAPERDERTNPGQVYNIYAHKLKTF